MTFPKLPFKIHLQYHRPRSLKELAKQLAVAAGVLTTIGGVAGIVPGALALKVAGGTTLLATNMEKAITVTQQLDQALHPAEPTAPTQPTQPTQSEEVAQ